MVSLWRKFKHRKSLEKMTELGLELRDINKMDIPDSIKSELVQKNMKEASRIMDDWRRFYENL